MSKYGLIGKSLSHSKSKEIHDEFFKLTNRMGKYDLFEYKTDEVLKEGINQIQTLGYCGINVTIPYKEKVIEFASVISNEAKKIGAVNTLLFKDNKIEAYNTDYFGFKFSLDIEGIMVKDKDVVIAGTGGASKAIIACIEDMGAKSITLLTRDKKKIQEKLTTYRLLDYSEQKKISACELFINTTPLGMYPNIDGCPIFDETINKFNCVVDIIFNPWETVVLRKARQLGKITINGMYMLVAQAIRAQEIWNGEKYEEIIIKQIYTKLKKEAISKNIILIGMPGCGKTTIGKIIACNLDMEFVDADDYIEEHYDRIENLFKVSENHFREIEKEVVKKLCNGENLVISTGGGVIKNKRNIENLASCGTIFFIDRNIDLIVNSINSDTRPLLKDDVKKIYTLYKERIELYKQYADNIILNNMNIDQSIEKIISKI